jgi:subtilisin
VKRSLFVLALAAALAMTAVPVHAADPATPEHPTWIVTLAPGTPASDHAAGLVGPLGGSVDYVYRHVLNGFAFRGSERAAQALEHNPNVLRVEPNRDVHMTGESASNGFFRIDADDAYYAGDRGEMTDGTPVRIAVLDTGIMVNHIDLAPNLDLANSYNCISPGQSVADDQGHGTHVAGIAASANQGEGMVGVASEASLVGIKVLDSTGYGTDAQVICGLDHVAGLVAADGVPTVVNFSLGEAHAAESGCASSGMHQAICNLTDDGVTVVAAAGNSAADSTDSFYPAAYPETIAVSAFAALDTTAGSDGCQFFIDTFSYECDDELASFTNYGSVVDVTAPGVRVQSTTFDGGWGLNSGTSMAAPFATGVAALILAADRTLTPNGVRSIMQTSGKCPDGTTAGAATCVGHGQWVIPSLFSPNGLPDPDGIP